MHCCRLQKLQAVLAFLALATLALLAPLAPPTFALVAWEAIVARYRRDILLIYDIEWYRCILVTRPTSRPVHARPTNQSSNQAWSQRLEYRKGRSFQEGSEAKCGLAVQKLLLLEIQIIYDYIYIYIVHGYRNNGRDGTLCSFTSVPAF